MANTAGEPPIGGHFEIDVSRPLDGAGGGLAAYAVIDRRGGSDRCMAVRVPDAEAPRAACLAALGKGAVPYCLGVVAHGRGRDAEGRLAQFVICPVPPGPSLADAGGPAWDEEELLTTLLRPVAAALAALQAKRLTHRAIRLDNVFQAARGQPVTLGCGWAGLPAARQPAVYEPTYMATCPAWGRDDGVIADDVYALGVLMVALARGEVPLAGLDPSAVIERKLLQGAGSAVIGQARLPPIISDLARGMLAEDPDHRPSPALLADPEIARTRRVAARPRRRAQRPIEVGRQVGWDARGLAHALAAEPAQAVVALRGGHTDRWLRRDLGEPSLALVLEEAVRQRAAETAMDEAEADGILLLRAVAILDPLAPPCWRGLRLWPGAIGSALAAASADDEAILMQLIRLEASAIWSFARVQRGDPVRAQLDARQLSLMLRQRGWAGGLPRLRYDAMPLLRCRAPVVAACVVIVAADLLPALEVAAAMPDRPMLPLDAELAAFLAARLESRMDADFAAMGHPKASLAERALAQLRVLARLQARHPGVAAPGVGAWLALACHPTLDGLRGRSRRQAALADLDQQAASGRLAGVLGVLDNPALLEADLRDATAAATAMARLDADIAAADRRRTLARADARRVGGEIAASMGVMAAAIALLAAVI